MKLYSTYILGHLKILNFPFGTNGKFIILCVPILKHIRVIVHQELTLYKCYVSLMCTTIPEGLSDFIFSAAGMKCLVAAIKIFPLLYILWFSKVLWK